MSVTGNVFSIHIMLFLWHRALDAGVKKKMHSPL